MSPPRILFVDDEKQVLDGLQNLLRKERRRWEMAFATGAQEALALVDREPFDVVVTDMRMPGMDGAQLLQHVKERHPATARIVLSGHAEQEAAVRALQVAHQFLSKPCDGEFLRATIERTVQRQALLSSEAIRRVIGRIDRLPSLPRIYQELMRATADPDMSVAGIARIVEQDAAMSVKILQIVNSAWFGLAHRMTSVAKAIAYLGVELLKGLALVSQVFGSFEKSPVEGFSLDRLQRHSLLAARLARRFVADPANADDAFTAGLVHDVGKIVLALSVPGDCRAILAEERRTRQPSHVIEAARLGLTHAELGAYLLCVWGLPVTVVDAVAFHHRPDAAGDGPTDVLAAVHVASVLADADEPTGDDPADREARLDRPFLERVGVAAKLDAKRAIAAAEIAKSREEA